jgi:hypothetical protein
MKPREMPIPAGSEISLRLGPDAYFHDFDGVSVPPSSLAGQSALAPYLMMVSGTPVWVKRLMALRNRLVGLVELKNLGWLEAVGHGGVDRAYRVGERIGIFSLLRRSEHEVILGDSDRHLDVQVPVCKCAAGCGVVVATMAHIHKCVLRIYMGLVAQMPQLILSVMVRRERPA